MLKNISTIMQASPQTSTINAVLNYDHGKILLEDDARACLKIGCFYLLEGPFLESFAQAWVKQISDPAIIISTNNAWYDYCLANTDIGLLRTKRCLYQWSGKSDNFSSYLRVQSGFTVQAIGQTECEKLLGLPWAEGIFDSYHHSADFLTRGFGFIIYYQEKIVSVCMSFAQSQYGVDVEVDTDPAFQGRGLAKIVAAHFISAALSRSLTPLWDATNPASAKVAEALGFVRQQEYAALSSF